MYLIGILQALGIVFVDTLYNLFIKFTGVNFEIKAFIFPFYYLLGNALTMMILAGPGRFAADTIKNLSTWVYGIAYLASFIVEIYLVQYVSSTELSILLRLTVPVCVILALIKHKRVPNKYDYFSLIAIAVSVGLVFKMQPEQFLVSILALCALLAVFEAMGYFIPENHSVNEQAIKNSGIRGQMRVISFATFVTTSLLFVTLIAVSFLDEFLPISQALGLEENFIKLVDFIHLPTILSGLLFGTFLAPFMRFFQWSASYKITSEGVLTIMAIIPLITFLLEFVLIQLNIMPISPLFEDSRQVYLFAITILLAVGTWLSAYLKSKKEIDRFAGKNVIQKIKNALNTKEQVLSIGMSTTTVADYEVIKSTIDFYEGDMNKAAKMLELPVDTVQTLSLTKNAYSLRSDISKKVHDIFRNKIFYLDQLTGVENKKGLIRQFAKYQDENKDFNLYYMDIDKFKSINDTLGHDIGDVAIITTVHRIRDYAAVNEGFAYRLGGDEFAMLTTSSKSEQHVIEEIKTSVSQPIPYNEGGQKGELNPSISIGKANVIKDSDVKIAELIKSADENMYKDKQETK